MAVWLGLAVWAVWTGLKLRKRAEFSTSQADRLASLLESAPALPLMVRNDGRIEAPERLADWLGLPKVPNFVSDLAGHNCGLTDDDAAALVRDVSAVQRTGRSFSRAIRAQGSSRTLLVRGAPAAIRLGSAGAVILWWFDATESQAEIGRLGEESARLKLAFDRLSGLIEAAPMPMWHRGPDMRIALVNNAYVRAVEAESAAEVIARGLELVDAGTEASPLAAPQRAKETNQPVTRVVPITVGGERRAARIVDVPLGDAGVAGFAMDVEEVERANAAFRRFVASQRDTLDRLSAGVAQFGADRSLLFCNQPFVRQFALKQEWVAERPNFDRLLDRMREANRVPETRDFPGWKAEHREWFTANDGVQEENWLLPDGAHLRVVAQPLPDGGLLAIFEDRTEQAQLASARDTLLRVRTATFDNMFEAVGVFESDGRLHLWNSRFRQVWDFEEDFLAGHPHVDALAEAASSRLSNPSRASLIREMVRSATVERQQRSGRLALKNGRHFEFAAVPLPDGNALFTMLDISDSRRVESVLRERADALEEANRVKSSFVANMSYELRTPLTSISGFAEMLQQGFGGSLEEQGRAYVAAILDSTERLSSLVDKVLDLTQSDAGQLPLERKAVDIAVMLNEAARDHRPAAVAKEIDFAIEIDQAVGVVHGDAKRLRQVFDHLLENSLTYTPEGGRILLHAEGDNERALVIVSDNGPGMNMAEQTAALDRFGRVGENRNSEASLGLGLPLAKQFVEAHGGSLKLVSEPGQGTLVRIELPR
ncbi:PAS domain-containing sensor histidine kinase [Aquisediminimonas profunda]|uniref:PAS domain-containing sensor histidine kinase n=1 Tax=Aquisediminimonas profunda TaxID=1550733 RepID=UPI001FEB7B5A|nr:PAS domain-containing sensor histidine kinase [Aquisediminimonas profunda]